MNRHVLATLASTGALIGGLGPAVAHPGHGLTDPASPLHAFEHLGLLASSPMTWLALALSGLLAYRLLGHRRHARRRRR